MMSLWSRLFGTKFSAAGWATAQYFWGRPVWTPRDYENFAKEGYQKNVVAYACVHRIATTLAAVPLYVMDGDKEMDEHPLIDLLNAPNPFMGHTEFFETLASYYLIAGNSYIERVDSFSQSFLAGKKVPSELYPLRPDRMRLIPDQRGWPSAFEYVIGGMKQTYQMDIINRRMPILHLKSFNPTNDWYGQSAIEAAMYSIDTHTEASAWNKSLLHNAGGPPGIINSKKGLTKEQRKDLREELNEKYTGPHNAGRPMIGDGEMEWIPMGFSPKDMEWLNSKNVSAREICLAFGTPPQVLGIPGDNTYSNLQEANIAFARGAVVPLLRRVIGGLNRWLAADYGDGIKLCYDEDCIPGLAQERRDIYAKVEATSFLTTDEKREATGFEAYKPGTDAQPGEHILVSTSVMMLEDVIAPPEPPAPAVDENGDPIVPDPNAPPPAKVPVVKPPKKNS